MHHPSGSDTENKVPLFRSVFNSDFRSNVCYRAENRYKMESAVVRRQNSEEDKDKEKRLSNSRAQDDAQETKDLAAAKPTPMEHTSYVGFANLPNQVYWKAAQRGFEFTLMVVGASGLGKSTLINSLFLTDVYDSFSYPGPTTRSKKTVSVETTKAKLKEGGVNLTLTLVDTPGYGDAINNNKSWIPIIEYIEDKYEDFFISESKVNRKPMHDQRVHCCLYFIQPSGHGLKPLDIQCMKYLSHIVNIIPVIAKADTLTPEECLLFKKQVLQDIEESNIKIYKFPDVPEDDEDYELNKSLKERVPFAVVGSNTITEVDGKSIRGRKYSWGVINIDNLEHCDFIALRRMVISTHMQDLKDATHSIHYENFRYRKLSDPRGERNEMIQNPLLQFEEQKQEHVLKLKKMEAEMENAFKKKLRQKEKELKDTEKLLNMQYEVTMKTLEEEARELREKRRMFELEKEIWDRQTARSSKESIEGKQEKKKRGLF